MGKSRISNARDVVCVGVVVAIACSVACGGASFPTTTELTKAPRQPDGVALEPPPALPPPVDRAEARGVVGLREPVASSDVEEVVRAYLRGFEREDHSALAALLTPDAVSLARPGTRQQLLEVWSAKMRSYEYQRIAGQEIARLAEMEQYAYDTLEASGTPTRPPAMRPGDLYVRIPMTNPRGSSEQLFGEVLVLLLRREDGRLKIAGQADE